MSEQELSRRAALGAVGAAVGTLAVASRAEAQEGKGGALKLFEKVDPSKVTKGTRPIVFCATSDSYIQFKTQDELKAWEDEIRTRLGVQLKQNLGTATESCSAGCTDDCDQ